MYLLECRSSICASILSLCIFFAPGVTANQNVQSADIDNARDAWVAPDEIGAIYSKNCDSCHGANLEGGALGPGLLGDMVHGDSIDELINSIAGGIAGTAMPAWSATLREDQIRSLAIYLLEKRAFDTGAAGMGVGDRDDIPTKTFQSEKYNFDLTVIADGFLHPYGMAVLPNGRFLVTEKTRGLSIVMPDGSHSLVEGTPKAYSDGQIRGTMYAGSGMILDVTLHPNYEFNGWIYLSFGDRCNACNETLKKVGMPGSMLKLVRGKILKGKWVNEEVIWQAPEESYHPGPDNGLGGRIDFDDRGYVYVTIGNLDELYRGVQHLDSPYGKTLRLHDDGRIPDDNPYVNVKRAIPAIFTRGHRAPQGLAFDSFTGQIWEFEHGPRGGDEANILRSGLNYGWPLVSLGLDYDGSPISYAEKLNIEFDPKNLEPPAIDWTPSVGISNAVFYNHNSGHKKKYKKLNFPKWENNLFVSTLKQNDLFRLEIEDGRVMHRETLLKGLGRFRDISIDYSGNLFILLEHLQGSRIIRINPARDEKTAQE